MPDAKATLILCLEVVALAFGVFWLRAILVTPSGDSMIVFAPTFISIVRVSLREY